MALLRNICSFSFVVMLFCILLRAYLFILYILYIIAQFYSALHFYKSILMCFDCIQLPFKQWNCLKSNTVLKFDILFWIYKHSSTIFHFLIFFFHYTHTLVL